MVRHTRHGFSLWLAAALLIALSGSVRAAGSGQERPTLSGAEQVLDTPHFRVHYTLSGADAIPALDADGSGTPDYVEFAARTMEEVRRVEVEELGWNAPPADAGEGGDTRYDVYLQDIYGSDSAGGDIAGYMDNLGGTIGDNPATPAAEARSSYSYLVLDHDYEGGAGLGIGLTVEDYLRVTAAHEYHHAIQAGYDADEPYTWLWEATSSWMESEVYPQVVDNLSYLTAAFKSPDTCLVGQGGDRAENQLHWYGMWVFLQSLDQTYGHDAIRSLWEQAITMDGYAALDAGLARYGDSLDAAIPRYAVRSLLHDYEREAAYPVLRLEGTIRTYGAWTPTDGVQSFGTDYVELAPPDFGPVMLSVTGEALDVRVIALDGNRADEYRIEGRGVVNLSVYERAYLLVTSLAREGNTSSCQDAPYSVTVDQTALMPDQPIAAHDAAHFLPPRPEPLADPDTGAALAADPAGLNLPFDVIVPDPAPPGYVLDSASTLSTAAFGDSYFSGLPPEGEAALLSYSAPDGTFFTVLESASPWAALDPYVAEHGLRTGEVRTEYKGIPALALWSASDAAGVGAWGSLTMIVGDVFVVVEGNAPTAILEAAAVGLAP